MDMHEVIQKLNTLDARIKEMRGILHLDKKENEIARLLGLMSGSDFWKDQNEARRVSGNVASIKKEVDSWAVLAEDIEGALLMAKEDAADKNVSLRLELEKLAIDLESRVADLEFYALLDEKYDEHDAIVAFHAGAGGTEAQDWTEMLLRMITRYAEKKGWSVAVLDEHRGQEAGFKSVMIKIKGRYAFGHLKSEHGVHRLVRISPFDAEKMRHTSFALVEVLPMIENEKETDIDPKDLRIDTFMAGGHGGQSVNTTYSAVRVVHIPTGITVSCQNERSQLQNRATAMAVLKSKLLKLEMEKQQKEREELRGEYQSAEWGSQIRSYVLHPYKMVKDLRSRFEVSDPGAVLDGNLWPFVEAYLRWKKTGVTYDEKTKE